jgi:YHS domain-containing protein
MIYRECRVRGDMMRDPVCGMTVDERTSKLKSEYQGKEYFFCSQGCMTSFNANPAKYSK